MMEMAIYFVFLFYQCDEVKRKVILRNIFLIDFVSEYTISIRNDSVYFNLYSSSVYYQYVFRLKNLNKKKRKYVTSFQEDRIRYFIILVDLYDSSSYLKYSFDILSKFLLTSSKKEANDLFHQLL